MCVAILARGFSADVARRAVTEAFYDEHMNVNVKGVVFTLQKLLPCSVRGHPSSSTLRSLTKRVQQ
jgi:hypothetical protein